MKTKLLSLVLVIILLMGILAVPVNAASRSDVYNYLKNTAIDDQYDAQIGCYYSVMSVSSDNTTFYGIFYYPENEAVALSIYTDSVEVTMILTPEMKLPYQAYVWFDDTQNSTGFVNVTAKYNGGAFPSFSKYEGNAAVQGDLLQIMNSIFPYIMEFTRAVIHEGGYTLADMGLTGYTICNLHIWDEGTIVKQPTCVESGICRYTCINCGQTHDESMAPTGEHVFDEAVVIAEATCTQNGTIRYTCSLCHQATKDVKTAALGHVWTLTEVQHEPEEGQHGGLAVYTCARCGDTKTAQRCAGEVFVDMPKIGNWAHEPIDWAYFNGITSGTSATTFSPRKTVTRAEVMTFLWSAFGRPAPEEAEMPFTDVKGKAYYYRPVLWAVQKGITAGKTQTTFAPKEGCTRAEIVTFLWSAAGRPEPSSTESPFKDVRRKNYYYKSVLWAVENGITAGTGENTFSPNAVCTRAQTVTFLYKLALLGGFTAESEPVAP